MADYVKASSDTPLWLKANDRLNRLDAATKADKFPVAPNEPGPTQSSAKASDSPGLLANVHQHIADLYTSAKHLTDKYVRPAGDILPHAAISQPERAPIANATDSAPPPLDDNSAGLGIDKK